MKKFFAALVLLVGLAAAGAGTVTAAYDPLGSACGAGGGSTAACGGRKTTDPISGTNGVLRRATKIVAMVAGIASVILVIVAGLQYVTSDGDSSKISSAKNTLIGAIVGLVIVAAAQAILTFVLSRVAK